MAESISRPEIPFNAGMGQFTEVLVGTEVAEQQTVLSQTIVNRHACNALIAKLVVANASSALATTFVLALSDDKDWSDPTPVLTITANGTYYMLVGEGALSANCGADEHLDSFVPGAFKLGVNTGNPALTPTADYTLSFILGYR